MAITMIDQLTVGITRFGAHPGGSRRLATARSSPGVYRTEGGATAPVGVDDQIVVSGSLALSTVLAASLSVVFVTALLLLVVSTLLQYRRRVAKRRAHWELRVHEACGEASTIVDLTTPISSQLGPPSTVTLTAVGARLRRLDGRLLSISGQTSGSLVAEAIEDLRRVGLSLAAALNAERALRLGGSDAVPSRAASLDRIAQRSAELNDAADELLWLVETA